MQENTLLSGSFRDGVHTSLAGRLANEVKEASLELRRDPAAFFASAFRGDGSGGSRRKAILRLGLAVALTIDATLFCIALLLWTRDASRYATGGNEPAPA